MQDAQVYDHLATFLSPTHAGAFQALREHGLAGGFCHAAANRRALTPVRGILHPTRILAKEAIGIQEFFFASLAELALGLVLTGRTQHLGDALSAVAQPAAHALEPLVGLGTLAE